MTCIKNYTPLAVLLMSSFFSASVSHAQTTFSGNDLKDVCTSDEAVKFGMCLGYFVGYNEGRNWGSFIVLKRTLEEGPAEELNELGNALMGHCVPAEVEYEQLIDVFLNYVDTHPETRHESARTLIWNSYVQAFPC